MTKPFVVWKLTEDSKEYFFLAPENHYNGELTAAKTGVALASDEEKVKYPIIPVANLLKSPVANRVNLSIRIGAGATAKRRSLKFVVAASKVDDTEAIKSGAYTTASNESATILGANEPLRRRYVS
ncbi:hypothetical protein [Gloeothece verrucosa]|uniref:Uncharacterized protein n=1 Tax=Gloeothece verrucosa (strain PCC 7822) TaxID=497965 RepID=E0U6Y2_GLOV7|nr:hypothetical protein [Gloeothece verrucosa]ADN16019.1 hypothetical protein Cyan7822_4099 [Gloeothece verrucosa PCC 7822]ADN16473.1 hypothetical protein Cyan7822_4564 [Gloeothece verrucosa PCC 7822]